MLTQEERKPLLVQQTEKEDCQSKVKSFFKKCKTPIALGAGALAMLGLSGVIINQGIHALSQLNQQCLGFDEGTFKGNCDTSADYEMSSSQEHACYCNSLDQQSFIGIVGGSLMASLTLLAPPCFLLVYACRRNNKETNNSTPTTQPLIKMHRDESNV
jgi:hypothetical protein